jgi:hypothetical protein
MSCADNVINPSLPWRGFWLTAGFVGLSLGCQSQPPVTELPTLPDVVEVQPLCPNQAGPEGVDCTEIARVHLMDQLTRSNGVVTHVWLEGNDGLPLSEDHAHCLTLVDTATCSPVESTTAHLTAQPWLTTVLVAPGTDTEAAQSALAMTLNVIDAYPEGTRIGLYRWGETITQIADYTSDRTVLERLVKRAMTPVTGELFPESAALETVRQHALDVSKTAFIGHRALVMVGHSDVLDALPEIPGGLHVTALNVDQDSDAERLAATINPVQKGGLIQLAFCPKSHGHQLRVKVRDTGLETPFLPPEPLAEEAGMTCSPADLLSPMAFPEAIDFRFTPTQRSTHDQNADTKTQTWFDLTLALWPSGEAVKAKVRFRGQSSMDCERKSYAVNISGKQPRFFTEGSATDQFYLVAMCLDNRYINQITANTLLTQLGTFPLKSRLIELRLDGKSRGIYLFIEEPEETLLRDNARLRSLIRRDVDSDGKAPEIKYALHDDVDKARADYEALIASASERKGQARLDDLRDRMDLDPYLRWIALMTLLQNGDYVDEVFFYSTESTDAQGGIVDYFKVVTWDPDDLFSICHHKSKFAITDNNALLFCTEGLIDHAMFADPVVYQAYVDTLSQLLTQITPDTFGETLDATALTIIDALQVDDVRLAMVELLKDNPDAADFEVARADILAAADEMKAAFDVRWTLLKQRIDDFNTKESK